MLEEGVHWNDHALNREDPENIQMPYSNKAETTMTLKSRDVCCISVLLSIIVDL